MEASPRMVWLKFFFVVVPVSQASTSIRIGSALLFLWTFLMSSVVEGAIAYYRHQHALSEIPLVVAAVSIPVTSLGMIILSLFLLKHNFYRTWLLLTFLVFLVQTAATTGLAAICGIVLSEQTLFAFTTRNVTSMLELVYALLTYSFTWWNGLHLWLCILATRQIESSEKKTE